MTSQNTTTLLLDDMESAVIMCEGSGCGLQLGMRLGSRKQVPEKCPSCGEAFDPKKRSVLVELLNFYSGRDVHAAGIALHVRSK